MEKGQKPIPMPQFENLATAAAAAAAGADTTARTARACQRTGVRTAAGTGTIVNTQSANERAGTKCGEATTGRIGEGEGTGLVQRQVERVPEPGSGAWISPTDAQPKPSSPGSARRQAVAGSARPKSPSVNHSRDWHIFLRRHLPSSQIFEINIKSPLHHSFSSKRYFNLKPNEGCQPESGS